MMQDGRGQETTRSIVGRDSVKSEVVLCNVAHDDQRGEQLCGRKRFSTESQSRTVTRTSYDIRVGLLDSEDAARGTRVLGLVRRFETIRRDMVAARVGALQTRGQDGRG